MYGSSGYGEALNKWGVEEYREVLLTLMTYRKTLQDRTSPKEDPKRLRRLDFMITDVGVHITELLDRENSNGKAKGPRGT